MTIMVPIVMFGYIPALALIFGMLPPRRAILVAFLAAWLFMPQYAYKATMLPEYSKMTAATMGSLVGVLAFDFRRILTFRPGWIDLPLVIWALAKLGSSIDNGYGAYDGVSSMENLALSWGVTWFLGRLYFSDAEGQRELVIAMVIGGLIYVPLCLLEVKMSPQLHTWIYGFHQHQFAQSKRFGGWRPTVFMQHGLMVGFWMSMTGLTAWWLWLTGSVKRVGGLAMGWATAILLITAVACKSFGAVGLLALGMAALWCARRFNRLWPLWAVMLIVPLYMTVRLTGVWSGEGFVEMSAEVANADRAQSLGVRLNSENQFIRAGWQRPWLGFRHWGDTIALQDENARLAIPDALWMIEFTQTGLVGMVCVTLYLLWPAAATWRRLAHSNWTRPAMAPRVGLAMVLTLFAIDCLFNGMLSPIYMLAAGGLGGWTVKVASAVRSVSVYPRRPNRGIQRLNPRGFPMPRP